MKFPTIKAPIVANIILAAISVFISGFGLLFGLAHLFEKRNPDIPKSEHMIGVTMATILTVIGVIFLLLAIAAVLGIVAKMKEKR